LTTDGDFMARAAVLIGLHLEKEKGSERQPEVALLRECCSEPLSRVVGDPTAGGLGVESGDLCRSWKCACKGSWRARTDTRASGMSGRWLT
jgi:hypothetical protein